MPLSKSVQVALKGWRSVFGEDTKVENWIKHRYLDSMEREIKKESGPGWVQYSGRRFVVISESDDFPEPRMGVIFKGGCDLPSVFTAAPLLREHIKGTIALARHVDGTGGNRSDQILQTLEDLPPGPIAETREMLKLSENYFEPTFFDPTFDLREFPEAGTFPKSLIIMSIASDEIRQMYRHREHGFIVDPGGWWLNQDLDRVLDDLTAVEWFRNNFRRIGRLTVDEFRKQNTRMVHEVRERIGAKMAYYTTMVVDPANPTHNYQLVKTAHSVRRREFAITLAELSAELDFPVIDIDRILKGAGAKEQVDFAHFPVDRMAPIGAEVYKVIREFGLA